MQDTQSLGCIGGYHNVFMKILPLILVPLILIVLVIILMICHRQNRRIWGVFQQKHTILNTMKRVAAIGLFVSFFLPLSSCEQIFHHGETIQIIPYHGVSQSLQAPQMEPSKVVFLLFMVVAFIWPIPVLLYITLGKRETIKDVLRFIEPFLCIGTMVMLVILVTAGNQTEYGAYLAWSAIIAYFVPSLVVNTSRFRGTFRFMFIILCLLFLTYFVYGG